MDFIPNITKSNRESSLPYLLLLFEVTDQIVKMSASYSHPLLSWQPGSHTGNNNSELKKLSSHDCHELIGTLTASIDELLLFSLVHLCG